MYKTNNNAGRTAAPASSPAASAYAASMLAAPSTSTMMLATAADNDAIERMTAAATMPTTSHHSSSSNMAVPNINHLTYINNFRVEQCQLFLQHKCTQHRPYTCFYWHFMNQRRRRPEIISGESYNYDADIYCDLYDEQTGICSNGDMCRLLHRNAGDTERRYHPQYYKTTWCTFQTDSRGHCVRNGCHCPAAHNQTDVRYEALCLLNDPEGAAQRSDYILAVLDKDKRANDDPKWNDTLYVLEWYKTEPCKRPTRICRQGYACPQYHNPRDRRRNPFVFTYRSTPCPNVKQVDEWGEPSLCENGDLCTFCHTRTEQQFHPEIYKTTKCNDIVLHMYCPRGTFCAFAHSEDDLKENRDSRSSQSSFSLLSHDAAGRDAADWHHHHHQHHSAAIKDLKRPQRASVSPQFLDGSWKRPQMVIGSKSPIAMDPVDMSRRRWDSSPRNNDPNLLSPNIPSSFSSEIQPTLHSFSKLSLVNHSKDPKLRIAPPPGLEQESTSYDNVPQHHHHPPPQMWSSSALNTNSRSKLNSQLSSSFGGLANCPDDKRFPFEHQSSLEQMISRSLENIGIDTASSSINFHDDRFIPTDTTAPTVNVEYSDRRAQYHHDEEIPFNFPTVSRSPTPQQQRPTPKLTDGKRSSDIRPSISPSHDIQQQQQQQQQRAHTYTFHGDVGDHMLKVPNKDSAASRSSSTSPGTSLSSNLGTTNISNTEEGISRTSDPSMIMAYAEKTMLEKEVDWLKSKVLSLEGCINDQKKALELMEIQATNAVSKSIQLERERNEFLGKYNEIYAELNELKRIQNRDTERIWSDQTRRTDLSRKSVMELDERSSASSSTMPPIPYGEQLMSASGDSSSKSGTNRSNQQQAFGSSFFANYNGESVQYSEQPPHSQVLSIMESGTTPPATDDQQIETDQNPPSTTTNN